MGRMCGDIPPYLVMAPLTKRTAVKMSSIISARLTLRSNELNVSDGPAPSGEDISMMSPWQLPWITSVTLGSEWHDSISLIVWNTLMESRAYTARRVVLLWSRFSQIQSFSSSLDPYGIWYSGVLNIKKLMPTIANKTDEGEGERNWQKMSRKNAFMERVL